MKYLLVIFLTLMAHKGMEEVYDYYFLKAFISNRCTKVYKDALNDKHEPAPLSKRFACVRDEMGAIEYLSYILARPHLTVKDNGGKWYY